MTATESLSVAVIESVATHEGKDEGELPPLTDTINPDALDELFEPRLNGTQRQRGEVTFTYCGNLVTVHRDGRVSVGN